MSGCKCKICDRSLRGVFLRYGGQSCSACASFFVRSLERKKMDYCCRKNKMCLSTPSEGGAQCQKCRFQKCIEIGMSCTSFIRYVRQTDGDFGEYLVLAKKLNALFEICTNHPQLLLNHLVLGDTEILEKCKTFPENAEKGNENVTFIKSWAKIFNCNQLDVNKIHILFYSIICAIQFPWLASEDQNLLFEAQQKSILQHLQPSTFASKEMQQNFEKLTDFFQKEYYRYYSLKKLLKNSSN